MRTIEISGRKIGDGQPPIISAEIGLNWNGDIDLGLQLIHEAAECGCDAVKFQNYRVPDFVKSTEETYTYGPPGQEKTDIKWRMFRQCELSYENLALFKREADPLGLIFHSTPTGETGVRDLLHLGIPVLKNGSDMLSNFPLIEAMAASALPTLTSTGEELGGDVGRAVEAFVRVAGRQWRRRLILLHCVAEYPTAKGKANLKRIEALSREWACLVGYSDHTLGTACAIEAVKTYGACWIEKHFTVDKSLAGPDHWFSADPEEMGTIVKAVKG